MNMYSLYKMNVPFFSVIMASVKNVRHGRGLKNSHFKLINSELSSICNCILNISRKSHYNMTTTKNKWIKKGKNILGPQIFGGFIPPEKDQLFSWNEKFAFYTLKKFIPLIFLKSIIAREGKKQGHTCWSSVQKAIIFHKRLLKIQK